MNKIKEININEAVIHILDNNAQEVVLNEYYLELNENIYSYLYKHINKALKSDDLQHAVWNKEKNEVKDISQSHLNGEKRLLDVSKDLAMKMFNIMRMRGNVPSADLIVVSISTEHGPLLGILKMDYTKQYDHRVSFVENKIGVDVVQINSLPSGKIKQCAFINPCWEKNTTDLMFIDTPQARDDTHYFMAYYLGCQPVQTEKDQTKRLVHAVENWVRKNLKEDAAEAEAIRTTIKERLSQADSVDIKELSEELFINQLESKNDFMEFVKKQGVEATVKIDQEWTQQKFKKVKLKIDKDIEITINAEAYKNDCRFEIINNGDGSVNFVIKNVMNYMEK